MLVVGANEMPVRYAGAEVEALLEEMISREKEGHADDVELVVKLDEIGVEDVVDVSRDVVGRVDDVSVAAIDEVDCAEGGE